MAGRDEDGRKIKVQIRGANELEFYIRVKVDTTVANFKTIIAEHCDIPPHLQSFVYGGSKMNADGTLRSHGVLQDGALVYVYRDPRLPDDGGAIDQIVDEIPHLNEAEIMPPNNPPMEHEEEADRVPSPTLTLPVPTEGVSRRASSKRKRNRPAYLNDYI